MRARFGHSELDSSFSDFLNTNDMYNKENENDDHVVDFSNAVLYVGALQIITATCSAALVSVLSCALLPSSWVSAVRTFVLSTLVGGLLIRKPFRLGRTHGLVLIFNALRPAVPIYISTLVLEQLVHSCARDAASPSWRRLVFHSMTGVCMLSGLSRARRPLAHTDAPFLATATALFVIAMLPPPAVLLSGPLCAQTTLASAAERLARAFVFSLLYSIFVYASAPPVQCSGETLVCTMRASAASIWVLGCHALLLPLAAVQAAIVIYTRIYKQGDGYDGYEAINSQLESELMPLADEGEGYMPNNDIEDPSSTSMFDGATDIPAQSPPIHTSTISPITDTVAAAAAASAASVSTTELDMSSIINPGFSVLGPRPLVDISKTSATHSNGIASQERMRQIAESLK